MVTAGMEKYYDTATNQVDDKLLAG